MRCPSLSTTEVTPPPTPASKQQKIGTLLKQRDGAPGGTGQGSKAQPRGGEVMIPFIPSSAGLFLSGHVVEMGKGLGLHQKSCNEKDKSRIQRPNNGPEVRDNRNVLQVTNSPSLPVPPLPQDMLKPLATETAAQGCGLLTCFCSLFWGHSPQCSAL